MQIKQQKNIKNVKKSRMSQITPLNDRILSKISEGYVKMECCILSNEGKQLTN